MVLKETVHKMKEMLHAMTVNLEKAQGGNRAAAQRVRTCTIAFAKHAKIYRKESVDSEKKGGKRAISKSKGKLAAGAKKRAKKR